MIQPKVIMLVFIVFLLLTKICRCGEVVDVSSISASIPSTCRLQCSNPLYCMNLPMSVDKKCCKQIDRKVESVYKTVDTVSNECSAINESLVLFRHDVSKNISDVRERFILLQQGNLEIQTWLDTANLKETLNNVNLSIDKINNTLQVVDSRCKQAQGDVDNVKQRTNKLDNDTTTLKDDVGNLHTNFSSSVSEMEKLQQDANTLKSEMSSLMSRVKTADRKSKDSLDMKCETLEKKIISIQENVTEFGDSHDKLMKSLRQELNTIKIESTKNLEQFSIRTQDSIVALQQELNTVVSTVQTLKEQTEGDVKMKIKLTEEKSDNAINQISNQLDKQVKHLSGSMDNAYNKVESKVNSMSKEFVQSKHDLTTIIDVETNKITIAINESSKRLHTELVNASKQTESAIGKHKLESTQSLADAEQRLNTLISDKIVAVGSKCDSSHDDLNKVIHTLKAEITQRIKEEVEQLASQTNEVNQTVRRQKETVDIIYLNTFNKEMFVVAFLLLVVMVCINTVIVYILVKRTSPAEGAAASERVRHLEHSDEPHSLVTNSNAVLNYIPSSPALERMICIISFDEDRQGAHKKLLSSTGIADNRVKCHVIRRHNQIADLPRCRVYLMCAEFTERHVIIEETGLGLGDLHRTTYDAVHKLGGHLIILYTRDPGSRRLKDGQTFNSFIYCVTRQPELAVINKEGCFISTYDKLTDGQRTHLRNKIDQYLE